MEDDNLRSLVRNRGLGRKEGHKQGDIIVVATLTHESEGT